MNKRTLTIAIAAITSSLAFGTQAVAQENDPQGLYSADEIIGSNVYHANDTDEDVGEVEDILLDDQGQVSALIVNAGGMWGMGGEDVVVDIEHFSMETEHDGDDVSHRILVDATEEELENFPSYDDSWFNDERERRANDGTGESVWLTSGSNAGSSGGVYGDDEAGHSDIQDDFE